jgi:NADH-quinone oxidoreductase subunit N
LSQAYFDGVRALSTEIVLSLAAFAVMVADLLFGARGQRHAAWVALAGLAATAASVLGGAQAAPATVFAMVEVDGFARFFKLLMCVGTAAVVLLWMFDARERRGLPGEAYFLLLGALLGGFVIVGTNNALLFVLGFELLSLSSYALAGFDKQRPASGEAAIKYIVFGSFATALMVYGISLLYGLTGTLDFARMALGDPASGASGLIAQLAQADLPVALALVLVLAGFAYKISLAPLHFWTPDVYEGSPTAVTTFLAVVSKVAGFGALLRFVAALFVHDGTLREMSAYGARFAFLLAILAAVTMTLGNLAALRQSGLKRLLAYSSIAHAGYAMIGVACMNETGFGAALVYVAVYALMNAGAFAALIYFEGVTGTDKIEALRGVGWKAPLVGVAMVVLLASLIGLPPTLGFYGKYRLFVEGWNSGMGWLVLVAAINTLISLFYYFRVVKALFLAKPASLQLARARTIVTLVVAMAVGVLVFGVWTRPLEQWVNSGLDLLRR